MDNGKMRTIFKLPIRKETTEMFYPNKISLDEFIKDMKSNLSGFEANLKKYPDDKWHEEKFVEQWVEMFLAWSEIEEE